MSAFHQQKTVWMPVVLLGLLLFPSISLAVPGEKFVREQLLGDKPRIAIEFNGLTSPQRANALGFLTLARYAKRDDLSELLLRHYFRKGRAQVAEAMEPLGYYDATVTGELSRRADGGWLASYSVVLGEPVRWRAFDISLLDARDGDGDLLNKLNAYPFKQGKPIDHDLYRAYKRSVLEYSAGHGYFSARWQERELRVDPKAGTADIKLVLRPGKRFVFGETHISDTPLDAEFINRFLAWESGEYFEASKLLATQYALTDSEYFRRVEIAPDIEGASDGEVPIDIELEPNKRNRYSIGAGYGTDTGIRVSGSWLRRWVNSRGHRMGFDARVSEVADQYTWRYLIPRGSPPIDHYGLTITSKRDEVPDGDSRLTRVGLERTDTRPKWQLRQYLNLERETFTAGDDADTTQLLMPGFAATRTSSNDPLFPTRGYRLSVDFHGSADRIISDTRFFQAGVDLKIVLGLWRKARLLGRSEFGYTFVETFEKLPASQRFYTGGGQSVRGFDFRDLAPRDAAGELTGGLFKEVYSVELEQGLGESWALAAFVDAGNAFNKWPSDRHVGAGVGFRLRLPVGALRFDLGYPVKVNDPEVDDSIKLHLSIGPDL